MSAPTPGPSIPNRRIVLFFFGGVALVYLSLSPLSVEGMGYLGEEMQACRQLLGTVPNAPSPGNEGHAVAWPRNGAVGLLFQCPFLAVSGVLEGPSAYWENRTLSIAPVLASALLVTLIFVWSSRLAGSCLWGFVLALVAGFCTMIWPYAYIGLETTQSLFLMLTAFLALGSDAPRTWPRVLLFGVCAAVAVSARSDGALLLPAVAYLTWEYFRRDPASSRGTFRWGGWKALAVMALIALVFLANAYVRSLFFARWGGTLQFARSWLAHDPVSPVLHLIGFFGSPNKGLIVYAPVTLLAIWSIPRAFAANRAVVIFALLTLFGLAGGISLLNAWTDETWGPRYLHAAIAPLMLCLAAARRSKRPRLRSEIPLLTASVFGFGVAFLGAFFYYGSLHVVASDTTPLTIEALQGETTWNHVRFNARLFDAWLHDRHGPAAPNTLERGRGWDARGRHRVPEWKNVDWTVFAQPQPLLIRLWGLEVSQVERSLRILCFLCLLSGLLLLAWCGWACRMRVSRSI